MKKFSIFLMIGIAGISGCSTIIDNRVFWNNVGDGNSLICKDTLTATKMVQFSYHERSYLGQALKIRNMNKEKNCFIVNRSQIRKTGDVFVFPLVNDFPESFRGVKQKVEEVELDDKKYWLINTKIN